MGNPGRSRPHGDVRVVVLGSGQDGGVPQTGFHPSAGPPRTATSIAVVTREGSAVLLDASPDLRTQQRRLLDTDPWYGSRRSGSAFDAVFLTHAHMGHYTGLVHFGPEAHNTDRLPVYMTESMGKYLTANQPWSRLFRLGNLESRIIRAGESVNPVAGVSIRPFLVPHRAEFTDTVGFSITAPGLSVCYLPDIDAWEPWKEAMEVLAAHSVVLVDGTFYDESEPSGRSSDEVPHPPIRESLDRFAEIANSTDVIFIHLNHSNPAADPESGAARMVRDRGYRIAVDGMSIIAS